MATVRAYAVHGELLNWAKIKVPQFTTPRPCNHLDAHVLIVDQYEKCRTEAWQRRARLFRRCAAADAAGLERVAQPSRGPGDLVGGGGSALGFESDAFTLNNPLFIRAGCQSRQDFLTSPQGLYKRDTPPPERARSLRPLPPWT